MGSIVEVKRRKGEAFESFMRRFNRRVQMSGKMLEVRKLRYFSKDLNEVQKKSSALRRLRLRDKREYLLKTGQLVEDHRHSKKR